MAETLLVLAQSKPAAATLTDVYTVPGATQAVVSTIVVCEQAGVATTYRLAVAVAGAADTPAQYLVYDATLDANESRTFTLGVSLGAADVIRARSTSGNVSFNVFGAQIA